MTHSERVIPNESYGMTQTVFQVSGSIIHFLGIE